MWAGLPRPGSRKCSQHPRHFSGETGLCAGVCCPGRGDGNGYLLRLWEPGSHSSPSRQPSLTSCCCCRHGGRRRLRWSPQKGQKLLKPGPPDTKLRTAPSFGHQNIKCSWHHGNQTLAGPMALSEDLRTGRQGQGPQEDQSPCQRCCPVSQSRGLRCFLPETLQLNKVVDPEMSPPVPAADDTLMTGREASTLSMLTSCLGNSLTN